MDGQFLLRVGSTNRQVTKGELSRLFQAAGRVHFALSPVIGARQEDLDQSRLGRGIPLTPRTLGERVTVEEQDELFVVTIALG